MVAKFTAVEGERSFVSAAVVVLGSQDVSHPAVAVADGKDDAETHSQPDRADAAAEFGGGLARDAENGKFSDSHEAEETIRGSETLHQGLGEGLRDSVEAGEFGVGANGAGLEGDADGLKRGGTPAFLGPRSTVEFPCEVLDLFKRGVSLGGGRHISNRTGQKEALFASDEAGEVGVGAIVGGAVQDGVGGVVSNQRLSTTICDTNGQRVGIGHGPPSSVEGPVGELEVQLSGVHLRRIKGGLNRFCDS